MKKILGLTILVILSTSFAWDYADTITTIKERISSFNSIYKRKKIDLLFNQPRYVGGDTALIRTLYLYAADRKPVEGREIIYIEFFDQKGVSVLREQIAVESGWSSNRIAIPAKLAPGLYQVVAWSDWMKNLDSSLFFKQDFIVAGPKVIQKTELTENIGSLEFYPEGGKFIENIKNNVVIRRIGASNLSHVSVKTSSATVATAEFDSNGLAEVSLTAEPGQSYHAALEGPGANGKKFELPPPQKVGFAIHVNLGAGIPSDVTMQGYSGLPKNTNYYLIFTNSAGLVSAEKLNLDDNNSANVRIPSLPMGVAQLSIVDDGYTLLASRTISSPGIRNTASITTNKKSYTTRENVVTDIDLKDNKGRPIIGYFSTRVISNSVFGDSIAAGQTERNILLYSDISSTFKPKDKMTDAETQRYLATQTCPWLDWTKINSGVKNQILFPVKNNPIVSGTVRMIGTGEPVQDSTEVTFFIEKQMMGYEELILDKGKFNFPLLFDFFGPDEIVYAATRKGRDVRNITVTLDKADSAYSFPANPFKTVEQEDVYAKYQLQKRVIDHSFSFYANNMPLDSATDRNIYFENILQGADITFRTSDYVLFPNMTELIREVLKAVDYRKMKGQDVVRVYTTNRQLPTMYVTPLFVIDGVFTKNPTTFVNLNPADIITIKIIRNSNKLTRMGELGAHGILLVHTRKPQASQKLRPENVFPVIGVSATVKGKALDYLTKGTQVPDLRSSLNWGSRALVDTDGKARLEFRTSDDVGSYKILIDGIDTDGVPFSKEETITVKFSGQP